MNSTFPQIADLQVARGSVGTKPSVKGLAAQGKVPEPWHGKFIRVQADPLHRTSFRNGCEKGVVEIG